jgi:DNA ligase-1
MSKRAGIMLCYPFEEKRLEKWAPPYIVQPKLDGERCRAVYDEDLGWQLVSSELNVFNSVPHINQALELSSLPHDIELDGELYVHGIPFESVHSIVGRTVNLHPRYQDMEYHIFDIVDPSLPQWERFKVLMALPKMRPGLRIVPMRTAEDLEGILKAYDEFIDLEYEGIIVRHIDAAYIRRRSTFIMKFKPKQEDTYKIVGFKQMVDKDGNPKEMLGALICRGDDGTEFSVGSGMTDELRMSLWPEEAASTAIGRIARVQYQHITPGRRVPRFPVLVEILDGDKFVNPLIE